MKKQKKHLAVLLICVCLALFSVVLPGCSGGGGSSSGGGSSTSTASQSAQPSTPAPAPAATATPAPANKGVLITMAMPDRSAYAVLVGIADYPGGDYDGKYETNDATGLKNALAGSALWNGASISIQNDVQVTKSMIQEAVNSARANIADDGLFVFFYSSSLTGTSGSTGYLITYDGFSDESKAISEDELKSWIDEFPALAKKYVLINAPADGTFIDKQIKRVSEAGKKERDFVKGAEEMFIKSLTGAANTYVMTSCRGSEACISADDIQNGIFPYFLCEGLGSGVTIGPADTNGNNAVTAEELTAYVTARVSNLAAAAGYAQNPQTYDNYAGTMMVK